MPVGQVTKQQMTFGGGINASVPAHAIGQDQLQTGTNLDFSIERGAIRPRRGYQVLLTTTYSHFGLYQYFNAGSINNGSLYTAHVNGVGRSTITAGAYGTYTQITPTSDNSSQLCQYGSYVYIAGGTALRKDNGTLTTEWIKQVPQAPTITLQTSGTVTAISSGASLSTLEGTSTVSSGTDTTTGDATTGRATLIKIASLNLGTNGGNITGTNGIIYTNIGFSDPQNVYRVSVDFAVDAVTLATNTPTVTSGTTTSTITQTVISTGFQNYWHGEYLPNIGRSLIPGQAGADTLTGAAAQTGTNAINAAQVASIQSNINADQVTPLTNIPFSANVLGGCAIPLAAFQFVGTWTGTSGDPWAAITAVKITVESYVTTQIVFLSSVTEQGDAAHCLTDMNSGYNWYQTYAELDSNGNFLGESAASPAAGPFKGINVAAQVVTNGTATGTIHGITHVITYRQGGYAQVPYAVNTQTYPGGTITDTMPDITQLLNDIPMTINVAKAAQIPYTVVMARDAFYERLYTASGNVLRWSQIGRPDQFVTTNTLLVSGTGDPVSGLVVWPPGLIIVNWQSVYEFTGSVFEGPNADYVLQKASCRRGTIAPLSIVKTPYGIPLLSYDGITMYQPGAGVDVALPWVIEQIGDAWRGFGGDDPAGLAGSRVPAINGNIFKAAAAFSENKLYIAVPTGQNSWNDTVFVLDFTTQKCWWYQYENIGTGTNATTTNFMDSLLWNFGGIDVPVIAGGTNAIYKLENFVTEISGSSTSAVVWNAMTRAWTVPNDTLVENLMLEYVGGPFQVNAIFDGTATFTLGTLSNTAKAWQSLPLNGVVTNNLVFQFQQIGGPNFTPHTAVYQVSFDSIPEPERVMYFHTDFDDNSYAGDKLWDVQFCDIGFLQDPTAGTNGTQTATVTGTVTAVTFIDGAAAMTNTMTGTTAPFADRRTFTFSFPTETYGEIAYTTYTSSQVFKLWDHRFSARNEPPRVTYWRTTIESFDEAICDAWDVDINPNGTVLATAYVDNTSTMTATITGTQRESYTFKLPVEIYGRTLYIIYQTTGTATGGLAAGSYFKHYNTWYHRRPEPDRWTNFVSDRKSTQEQHFDAHEVDVNPLGNTVLGTALIDGTPYGTFTYTGSLRERFVNAFPANTYGKTCWTQFSVSAGTDTALDPLVGRFKYFSDHFIGTLEPDRLTFVQKILPPWPSEQYAKTWVAELNPLGTCTGTFMVEGNVISTATFTGTIREMYQVGVDNPTSIALQTATAIEVRYSGTLFKHYQTQIETEPKPFGKTTWAISYKKAGGASQIDMARFWAIEVEIPPGTGNPPTVLMTSIWDIDDLDGFSTNTMTLTRFRTYIDRIPFPPGGRGRDFQQRISFSSPAKVWRSSLDSEHIGVKGLARITVPGTPHA